jgi:hypothetical protein
MNERIKKLYLQAGGEIDRSGAYFMRNKESTYKFAELIVRKCIESLWTQEHMMSDLALEDFNANKQRILNYFGIEK